MPLAVNVSLDDTTWFALALVLTILGAVFTWVAWRRRGLAAGIRGLAWTLIPVAAWLTGTLKLAGNILEDVINWGARVALSPVMWVGIIVAGLAALLWVTSGVMRARGIGVWGKDRETRAGRAKAVPAAKPGKQPARKSDDDLDDMDDIEAILKRHGI